MDVFIELILWVIAALAGKDKPKTSGPRPAPILQQAEQATRSKIAAAPPRPVLIGQDPAFRNTGWCLASVVLAFLLALAAAAVLLMRGLAG